MTSEMGALSGSLAAGPQCLSLLVTTHCNRQCPECCFQIPRAATMPTRHETWEYFERAAPFFRGLRWLGVSGGEPTLHPEFRRIAREFRALFGPGQLALITNGARVLDYCDEMACFDEVYITDFDDERSVGAIAWMRQHLPGRLQVWTPRHVPLSARPGAFPCEKRTIAIYAVGRLFPCCAMPGIADAPYLELTDDWRTRLAAVPLPCAQCRFAWSHGERP